MDFHSMKRKKLQALCKKHNIRANLKNVEMADRLTLLFKVEDAKGKDRKSSSGEQTMKQSVKRTAGKRKLEDLEAESSGKSADFVDNSAIVERSDRIDKYSSGVSNKLGDEEEKHSIFFSNVPDDVNMTDDHLDENHYDASDRSMEVEIQEDKSKIVGYDQDAKVVSPAIKHSVLTSNVPEGASDVQQEDNNEQKVEYIEEVEEVATAMIYEQSEVNDSDKSGNTSECERSHEQGLEAPNNSQLTSDQKSYDIASLFQSEFAEDENGLIEELKGGNLFEVSDAELDGSHEKGPLGGENIEVHEEKETYEVSPKPGDVIHSIDWEEFGNIQSNPDIVHQSSEEKLTIQSSVDGEKTSDVNGACTKSRATVEMIAEEDLIGLAIVERSDRIDKYSSGVSNKLGDEEEKHSIFFINVPDDVNMTDVHLDENHYDASDRSMEVEIQEDKSKLVGYDQDAKVVSPTIKHSVLTSNVPEGASGVQQDDNNEQKVEYIQEVEEVATAMIYEQPEVDDSDKSGNTSECERSHEQGLEAPNKSQLTSDQKSYDIASLFQSEFAEDENGLVEELKGGNLLEVSGVELDGSHEKGPLAGENIEVHEEKETYEVSQKPGDVIHSIDWEEFGNLQRNPDIVLQSSEEKLTIQSSVDGEKTSDVNGACTKSRATVEMIAPSPAHAESEEDLIGLAVFERFTEQTEQQTINENFVVAYEAEGADGENFELVPEPDHKELVPSELAICNKDETLHFQKVEVCELILDVKPFVHPELSMEEIDDQCKSADVTDISKEDTISPIRPVIAAADMKENSKVHLKRELNVGDATAFRPLAKRKALGELHRQ